MSVKCQWQPFTHCREKKVSSNNTAVFPEPRRAAPPEQNAVVCCPFGGKSDREQTNDGKLLLPLQRGTICSLYFQLAGVLLMHDSQFIRRNAATQTFFTATKTEGCRSLLPGERWSSTIRYLLSSDITKFPDAHKKSSIGRCQGYLMLIHFYLTPTQKLVANLMSENAKSWSQMFRYHELLVMSLLI